MSLAEILVAIGDYMYLYVLVALLIVVGVFMSIKTRFVQFRLFPETFKVVMEKKSDKEAISSFQALMVATASRVGTGNIAGIATALVAGGPGALFWMWIMALIGGASAFAESTLAQIYKERDGAIFKGGPSYYIEKALGMRWLGIVFSIILIITFAYGFNGLQSYNIASAFEYYSTDWENSAVPVYIGLILAVVSTLLFFGGVGAISRISSILVPIMAAFYIFMGLSVVVKNFGMFPEVISMIVKDALDFKAIFGGMLGSCLVMGIKRGLFSNEAGEGSAPNAAATATVSHPVKQGLVQTLGVYFDTLVVCSITAFIILLGTDMEYGGEAEGVSLTQKALSNEVGDWGIHLVTFILLFLAFSSILGNYYLAEANVEYLTESRTWLTLFRAVVIFFIWFGAVGTLPFVFALADTGAGTMVILNIAAIIPLSGVAIKLLKNFNQQRLQGIDPVFHRDMLPEIKNIEVWDGSDPATRRSLDDLKAKE